jgi:hypothetical protein
MSESSCIGVTVKRGEGGQSNFARTPAGSGPRRRLLPPAATATVVRRRLGRLRRGAALGPPRGLGPGGHVQRQLPLALCEAGHGGACRAQQPVPPVELVGVALDQELAGKFNYIFLF